MANFVNYELNQTLENNSTIGLPVQQGKILKDGLNAIRGRGLILKCPIFGVPFIIDIK